MIYPKIVRGGNAIPIGDNLFLMKGRKHKNGGIDIGKDLEVEGGEVMQTSPNEIKVFSAQKFLGGESPAELILSGANPDRVFAAQEKYKDVHGINDDGTKKKAKGGSIVNWIKNVFGINSDNTKSPVEGENGENNFVTFDYNGKKIDINKNELDVLPDTILSNSINPDEVLKGNDYTKKPMTRHDFDNNLKLLFNIENPLISIDKTNKTIKQINKEEYSRTIRPKYEYLSRNDTNKTIEALKRIQLYDKIKEISDDYGINPNLIARRFIKEGAFDKIINDFNWERTPQEQKEYDFNNHYKNELYSTYGDLGLDTFKELYDKGKINIKNNELNNYIKNINTRELYNEKKHPIRTFYMNIYQALESYAAFFKYLKDKYPNADLETLNAMFNRGEAGAKKMNKEELYKNYSIPEYYTNGIHNKKQYGGMTNKENNANILGYVPSIGKRKKALLGTDGKNYNSASEMPFGVFPAEANWNKSNNINNKNNNINYKDDITRGKRAINTAHWLTYGLGAGTDMLSAILGSSVEHSTTNKAINEMKELVGKIKSYNLALPNYNTHVEVEPQLAENRRTAAYLMRDIDANIYDSKKALGFKRKILGDKLYKDILINQYKINEENKLRNIKTEKQYNVINENIRNANNIENQKLAMLMEIADKQSENDANLTRNIVGGINSGVRTFLTGLNQKEQMRIAGIDSPEGDNAIYGITGKSIREREEERERKRKEFRDKRKFKNDLLIS